MKKISLLLITLIVVMFASCEKDQDMIQTLPVDDIAKPVLQAHDAIVCTADNAAEMVTFNWEEVDFGVPTVATYSLYIQTQDESFAVSASNGESLEIKYEDLNKILLNSVGLEPNVPTDVQFFVEVVVGASSVASVKKQSDPVTINVTAFKPVFPDNLYMVGAEFGNWNWGDAGIVEMTPVNGTPGKFWAVRYFADPASGFKWNTIKDWGGDFFSLGTDVGFTNDGGNAFVSAAGFYMVLVDYTTNTITIEPAKVWGMGDAFGGWNTGQYPFVADSNVMKLTATAAGELRIYAYTAAAGIPEGDWWRMEFVILDGKIVYRGNGGDQTRVPVTAGQVVTLDFNAGTGTIE